MGGRRLCAFIRVWAPAVCLGWPLPVLAQEASIVRVTQVDGAVEIRKSDAGAWRPLREGEIIERGDSVAGKEKSAAVLTWSNGSIVKIYPDTVLSLAGVTFDLDRKMERTFLELEKGRLFVKGQVPDNIFCEFQIRTGAVRALTQGAEFALTRAAGQDGYTTWVLLGRVVAQVGDDILRIEESRTATLRAGEKPAKDLGAAMDEKTRQALTKVSSELGGSLLVEEEGGDVGGKLAAKIGGVRSRRGNAPYKVRFHAIVRGGTGKVRSVRWDFGDGESSEGREAEHAFTQGLYGVTLWVEDENGDKTSAQISISAEESCAC